MWFGSQGSNQYLILVGELLRKLRKERRWADYQADHRFRHRDARRTVTSARLFLATVIKNVDP